MAAQTLQASVTSKLVVISAVLANMMLAEQYLSWLMATARSMADPHDKGSKGVLTKQNNGKQKNNSKHQ